MRHPSPARWAAQPPSREAVASVTWPKMLVLALATVFQRRPRGLVNGCLAAVSWMCSQTFARGLRSSSLAEHLRILQCDSRPQTWSLGSSGLKLKVLSLIWLHHRL